MSDKQISRGIERHTDGIIQGSLKVETPAVGSKPEQMPGRYRSLPCSSLEGSGTVDLRA